MNQIQPISSDFELGTPGKETAIAVIPEEKKYVPSDYGLNFDLEIVKSCIQEISKIDKTQTGRALAAT